MLGSDAWWTRSRSRPSRCCFCWKNRVFLHLARLCQCGPSGKLPAHQVICSPWHKTGSISRTKRLNHATQECLIDPKKTPPGRPPKVLAAALGRPSRSARFELSAPAALVPQPRRRGWVGPGSGLSAHSWPEHRLSVILVPTHTIKALNSF